MERWEAVKKQVQTDQAPGAPFLSQAVISNGMVYVSGQVHNSPDGQIVDGSVTEKLERIMQNISTILGSASASLDDVVKVTIFVTDMSQMPELNQAYSSYFAEPRPAREAIGVQALPLGATIEVSVVAEVQE
jgi:2-iminobutanoate/2-iminopropanoate deaminase